MKSMLIRLKRLETTFAPDDISCIATYRNGDKKVISGIEAIITAFKDIKRGTSEITDINYLGSDGVPERMPPILAMLQDLSFETLDGVYKQLFDLY